MEYLRTVIYVDSVEETLDFYYQAFHLSTAFLDEEGQYGELDIAGSNIAFCAHTKAQSRLKQNYIRSQPKQPALGVELVLQTDDLVKTYQQAVDAGAEPLMEPCALSSGGLIAYVRSIEGTLISLTQKMVN